MSWQDWPATRQPGRSALAVGVIAITAGAAGLISAWLGILSAVILVIATAEALLPTRYTLDDAGVVARNTLRRRQHPWSHFAASRRVPEGVFLVGRGVRPWLARRRNLLLRCTAPEAVAAFVAQHLGAA